MSAEQPSSPHVDRLMEAYPRLFRTPASVGVWFPAGWTRILHDLCQGIDVLLDDAQARWFRIDQVKEKFGTLRFYYSVAGRGGATVDVMEPDRRLRLTTKPKLPRRFPVDAVDRLIAQAEAKSEVTCFRCGAPGVLRSVGWHHVSCDACEAAEDEP